MGWDVLSSGPVHCPLDCFLCLWFSDRDRWSAWRMMWHEQLREPSLSGIHYHSQAGRTLFSTPPCPGLVLSPRWSLCCSKQDKSKTGLWAKLSSLPAPGPVLYIYCLGAETAAGRAQDRNSGWDFSTHLSFLGRQRGDPRSFFIPCFPLTGRRKGPRWRGPLF